MLIDCSPRQSGKTTRAIQWLIDNKDGVLIVHSYDEVKRLQGLKLIDQQDFDNRIMTYESYINDPTLKRNKVFLDNAEIFLLRKFHNLQAFSLSNDDPTVEFKTNSKIC